VVLTAAAGLIDIPELLRMWRVSRIDFHAAAIALIGVLLLGILQGILLAAVASVVLLLLRATRPHVASLGRVPGTRIYSDRDRHPENETIAGVLAFRPEASLIYVNTDTVLDSVLARLAREEPSYFRLVVCDPSASPHVDLAGSQMLHKLHTELVTRKIELRIVGATGSVRDLLRADKLDEKVGTIERDITIDKPLEVKEA